jgi:hypothetical protein
VIPVEVDILGKPYAITVTAKGEGDYGECFADHCRIEIAGYPCVMQQRDTLLHEVLHGIDHEMHCGMSEPQIRRMATGLLQVLRHNAGLVAYLVGTDADTTIIR